MSREEISRYFPEAEGVGSRSVAALEKIQRVGVFFVQTNHGIVIQVNGECPNMTQDGCIHGAEYLFMRKMLSSRVG